MTPAETDMGTESEPRPVGAEDEVDMDDSQRLNDSERETAELGGITRRFASFAQACAPGRPRGVECMASRESSKELAAPTRGDPLSTFYADCICRTSSGKLPVLSNGKGRKGETISRSSRRLASGR